MLTQNFFLNIIFIILIFKYFCQCNNQNLTFSQQNSTKNIFEIKNENNNNTLIETTTENLKEEEEEPAWACGTDAFIQMIAESTIEKDCPDKKRPINNCCVSHDSCYDDQKGRKYCDDIFCECLEIASAGSEECSKVDTKMFCDLVREFGQSFYNASVNATNTTQTINNRIEITTPTNTKPNNVYNKIDNKTVPIKRIY
uniref:Uncharacterized protein n=1 Tax=Meloidogyne enterolobii TaxID=390850 RepID=A0A6V7VLL5_MELEN|nr:unnamed protein product [Meloidogyne enterolobii]